MDREETDVCFGAGDVQSLISGNLHPERRERLFHHAAACESCREELRRHGVALPQSAAANVSVEGAATLDAPRSSPAPTGTPSPGAAPPDIASQPTHVTTPSPDSVAKPPSAPAGPERPFPYLDPPLSADELGRLGDYRILRVLGEGGMGTVFEADDTVLGRRVAIKVVRPVDGDDSLARRFLQEARLAASLPHDRIVTIFQVGQTPCPYIVMELLRGETLEDRLVRESWLPLAEALRIAGDVAEGLEVAHDKRLVHRDIKPGNVFLEQGRGAEAGGRVKLLDFGVARPIVSAEQLTMRGRIVGTPEYMSPEQACGFAPDGRSDLFSLGCLLYAMLVGESPFRRTSEIDSLQAVVHEPAPSLRDTAPQLPDAVVTLVNSLLSKSPQDRPRNARQVVEEIRRLGASRSSSKTYWGGWRRKSRKPWSRNKKLGWSAASGAVTIVAAAVFGAWIQWHDNVAPAIADAKARRSAAAAGVSNEPPGSGRANAGGAGAPGGEANPAVPGATPIEPPPVKVGLLLSMHGVMASTESPLLDALLMAIDEINAGGGVLGGRKVAYVLRDGQSRDEVFAARAEELIATEQVAALFGCWRSSARKAVEVVCRKHDNLLVYPVTYEGLEESPYVIYMGGAPNQQLLPAAKWAFAFLGKRRFFLVGADGIYSDAAHEILKDEFASLGATVVGDERVPLGSTHFETIAEKIKTSGADCVMNTVSGAGGNFAFFHCLSTAGVDTTKTPTISFRVTELDIKALAQEHIVGNYAAWSYFQSLASPDNDAFLERFRRRYPGRVVTDPMEAAYNGIRLWAMAVNTAGSERAADVRRSFPAQSFAAPEGSLTVSAENRHAARFYRIGQVDQTADILEFDIVDHGSKPIPPEPFPRSRSKAEWLRWLSGVEQRQAAAEQAADHTESHPQAAP